MKRKATIWLFLATGLMTISGCDESATKQVKVPPPAAAPTPAPTPQPSYARQTVPVTPPSLDPGIQALAQRPAIDLLVDKVQSSFDAGEQASTPEIRSWPRTTSITRST